MSNWSVAMPAMARDTIEAALRSGKDVVTANKALLAMHGQHLAQLAESLGRVIRFEAAVAGGIPVIKTMTEVHGREPDHPGDGGHERHLQLYPDAHGKRRPAL